MNEVEKQTFLVSFVDIAKYYGLKLRAGSTLDQLSNQFSDISISIFELLKGYNVPVAAEARLEDATLSMAGEPIEQLGVRVTNVATKKMSEIFGINENAPLNIPVYEFYYGNSFEPVNETQIVAATDIAITELRALTRLAAKTNVVLRSFFERRNALLKGFNCYFSRLDSKILLAGDFSPFSLSISTTASGTQAEEVYDFSTSKLVREYQDYLHSLVLNNN